MAPRSSVPLDGKRIADAFVFAGTGSAATDTPAWGALVTAINAANKPAFITIADRVQPAVLDSAVSGFTNGTTFNNSVIISGETKNARLKIENGFLINWGGTQNYYLTSQSVDPLYYTRGTFDGVTARSYQVVVTSNSWLMAVNSGAGPKEGDLIAISSLDTLIGCDSHLSGGQNNPGEIHRVARVDNTTTPGTSVITLASRVADTMTISPMLCWIKPINNAGMKNLTLESTLGPNAPNHNQTTFLSARRCHGFILEDLYSEHTPGTIQLLGVTDAQVNGLLFGGVPDRLGDYGVVLGDSNGFRMQDCTIYDARHIFSTGGQTLNAAASTLWNGGTAYASGATVSFQLAGMTRISHFKALQANTGQTPASPDTAYWTRMNRIVGTPQNGVIQNCDSHMSGNPGVACVGFDIHSSGFNMLFEDCVSYSTQSGVESNGFSTRARKTRYHRCKVYGNSSPNVIGFTILGGDSELKGCELYDCDQGIRIQESIYDNVFPNHIVDSCTFEGVFWSGVRARMIDAAKPINNITVKGCSFVRTAYGNQTGTNHRACITIEGGTGHRIRANHMDKELTTGNQFSVDVKGMVAADIGITGNFCRGYGSGVAGLTQAVIDGSHPDIGIAYNSRNYTD